MKIEQVGVLRAPSRYWILSDVKKRAICNGCGPSGNVFLDFLTWIIPDSLLGLDITEACNIHDYCWSITWMPKKTADNLFLDNMSALIDSAGGVLASLRHIMAFHYWLAVKNWRRK